MFVVNVEGAIERNGKWLLILRSEKEEHAGGTLSLVGGKCELEGFSSDILERTLKREIYEEVGCEVAGLKYVNSSSFVTDSGINVIDIVFLCHHKSIEPYPKSSNEVDDVIWMTTSEILANTELPEYLKDNIKLSDKILQDNSYIKF
ncbi:NUDIX domain-containing protein [Anaerobacillus sp. 1_MG-2023]|uniref:NUDIX domain-containing protein n=1 Tax=Anaerobacillus sp. 1_MG-2023 TaxID=3062655 RepID=UPI0026E38915|nr:NUDIX domain-containing protein [Anaerobacillus sp. 1_MG-2023]MDO6658727.1 NUDIX domain-containing protein [Anaerobacillus sp. 1_MG-2023]